MFKLPIKIWFKKLKNLLKIKQSQLYAGTKKSSKRLNRWQQLVLRFQSRSFTSWFIFVVLVAVLTSVFALYQFSKGPEKSADAAGPVLTGTSPTSGPSAGGTEITLLGSNFESRGFYRRTLSLNNPTGSTITNAKVLISLDTATLILEGKLRSDCSDLRVVGSNDSTPVNFWMESGVRSCNKSNTAIWVTIPSLTNGASSIYLYYGNPFQTTNLSSLNGVFPSLASASNRVWLDASRGLETRDVSGNMVVDRWNDQAGSTNNYGQSGGLGQPRYTANGKNGRPVLDFFWDGGNWSNFQLQNTSSELPQFSPVSVISTFKMDSANNNAQTIIATEFNYAMTLNKSNYTNQLGGVSLTSGTDRNGLHLPVDTVVANTWYTTSAVFNITDTQAVTTSNVQLFRNGTQVGGGYVNPVYSNWNPANFAFTSIGLGYNNSYPFDGSMGEMIIYNGAIGATDRQEIENYLNIKYQLYNTSNLPSSSLGSETKIAISVGASQCFNISFVNVSGQLKCKVPPAASFGPVAVNVTNPNGETSSGVINYTYSSGAASPSIGGINPNRGDKAGGYTVTLNGNEFNTSGGYRRTITVNNPTGASQENVKVLVSLNTQSLISGGKLNANCTDLRFYDALDTSELSFWIENGLFDCSSGGRTTTNIWVNIPALPSGNHNFIVRYGFPSLTTSASSLANTFSGSLGGTATNKLWLDASVGTSTTTNGADLSDWNDQSGNGNHAQQGFASNQPNYYTNVVNSRPVIRFSESGAVDYMLSGLDTGGAGKDYTILVAAANTRGSLPGIGGYNTLLDTANDLSNGIWLETYNQFDGLNTRRFNTRNDSFARKNGLSSPLTLNINEFFVGSVKRFSPTSSTYLHVGAGTLVNGQTSTHGQNNIAEVIILETNLNDSNLKSLEWYLQQKYAISTSNVPQVTNTGPETYRSPTVTLGGNSCTSIIVISANSLSCTAPSNANTGSVDVVVTNPDTQAVTLSNGFTYTQAITNSDISTAGGSVTCTPTTTTPSQTLSCTIQLSSGINFSTRTGTVNLRLGGSGPVTSCTLPTSGTSTTCNISSGTSTGTLSLNYNASGSGGTYTTTNGGTITVNPSTAALVLADIVSNCNQTVNTYATYNCTFTGLAFKTNPTTPIWANTSTGANTTSINSSWVSCSFDDPSDTLSCNGVPAGSSVGVRNLLLAQQGSAPAAGATAGTDRGDTTVNATTLPLSQVPNSCTTATAVTNGTYNCVFTVPTGYTTPSPTIWATTSSATGGTTSGATAIACSLSGTTLSCNNIPAGTTTGVRNVLLYQQSTSPTSGSTSGNDNGDVNVSAATTAIVNSNISSTGGSITCTPNPTTTNQTLTCTIQLSNGISFSTRTGTINLRIGASGPVTSCTLPTTGSSTTCNVNSGTTTGTQTPNYNASGSGTTYVTTNATAVTVNAATSPLTVSNLGNCNPGSIAINSTYNCSFTGLAAYSSPTNPIYANTSTATGGTTSINSNWITCTFDDPSDTLTCNNIPSGGTTGTRNVLLAQQASLPAQGATGTDKGDVEVSSVPLTIANISTPCTTTATPRSVYSCTFSGLSAYLEPTTPIWATTATNSGSYIAQTASLCSFSGGSLVCNNILAGETLGSLDILLFQQANVPTVGQQGAASNDEGQVTISNSSAPTLSGVSPNNGVPAGGNTVTVSGANFEINRAANNSRFRRQIILNNPTGGVISVARTLVTINTATLISSSKMNANCTDLRVKESDESTAINYWIEPGTCNTSSTRVWVSRANLAVGSTLIYLTYGDSSFTSTTSSLNNVFPALAASNNRIWLDADKLSGADNSAVSSWTDQTSNSFTPTQGTGANQPLIKTNILNGRKVVRFDGVDDFFSFSGAALGVANGLSGATMFSVSNQTSNITGATAIFIATSNTSATATRLRLGKETNRAEIGARFDGGTYTNIINPSTSTNAWSLHSGNLNLPGQTAYLYENGQTVASNLSYNIGSSLTANNSQTALIGRNAFNSTHLGMDLAEFIFINSSLSINDQQQVQDYLNIKYQLYGTSSLPSAQVGSEQAAVGLTFGGNNCTAVSIQSSSSLTCVVPAGTGTVNLLLTNPDGQTSGATGNNLYSYGAAAPTISSISQNFGGVNGGTNVQINGANFDTTAFSLKKRPITLTSASAQTDYQVLVTLDTASLISAGKMQSDCDDIRFFDTDSTTQINFYLQEDCNTSTTRLWVKVPTIPVGQKVIYVGYGDAGLSSVSSAANTFIANSIFQASGDCTNTTNCNSTDNMAEVNAIKTNYPANITQNYVASIDDRNGGDMFYRRYRFLFIPNTTASYSFMVNSDDASVATLFPLDGYGGGINTTIPYGDHTELAAWYFNHGDFGVCATDGTVSSQNLVSGKGYWLDYLMVEWTNGQLAQLCINNGSGYQVVSTTAFPGQIFSRKYPSTGAEPSLSIGNELGSMQVTFDGNNCTNIVVVNPTAITCTTPAGTLGGANVVVTNPNGQSTGITGNAAFTYTSSNLGNILFVVGDSPVANNNSGDDVIRDRLEFLGYTVVTVDDTASQTSDANGKAVVVISQSVSSAQVNTKFTNVSVPVVNMEDGLNDDLLMTSTGTSNQGFVASQTQINIDNASHPLAAGLAVGSYTIYNSSGNVAFGKPNGNAVSVASVVADSTQKLIYGYESGAILINNTTPAPSRRVGFYFTGTNVASSGTILNNISYSLFDATILWASQSTINTQPITNSNISSTGGSITCTPNPTTTNQTLTCTIQLSNGISFSTRTGTINLRIGASGPVTSCTLPTTGSSTTCNVNSGTTTGTQTPNYNASGSGTTYVTTNATAVTVNAATSPLTVSNLGNCNPGSIAINSTYNCSFTGLAAYSSPTNPIYANTSTATGGTTSINSNWITCTFDDPSDTLTCNNIPSGGTTGTRNVLLAQQASLPAQGAAGTDKGDVEVSSVAFNISSVNPNQGTTAGGYSVQVLGANLTPFWGSNHRRPITVNNPTGSAITNAVVLTTVDTATLITEGKLKNDCGDLRVKATDQTTDLAHYIETGVQGCNKSNTAIWVRIPSLVNGNTTIYLTYGNTSLTSASNLSTTIPSLATNNQLWFDASRGTSTTTSNSPISQWSDQSGNNRHAYAVANPIFKSNALNGRPAIGFNNYTDPNYRLRFSTVSNIRSTFWVIKHNTGSGNDWATILGRGPEDVQPDFHGSLGTALFNSTWGSPLVTGGSGYVNGALTTVTNITKPTSFSTISFITTGNVSASVLGADDRNSYWDRVWDGDIAEVLAFSSALSATDRQEVENYLNLKYQMYGTANLPTTSLGVEENKATLTFGGNNCPITASTSTTATCTVPSGSAGAVNVVYTNSNAATSTLNNGFTYLNSLATITNSNISTVVCTSPVLTSSSTTCTITLAGASNFSSLEGTISLKLGSTGQVTVCTLPSSGTTTTCSVTAPATPGNYSPFYLASGSVSYLSDPSVVSVTGNIYSTGLSAYYDANFTASYPGTGSSWNDISGNNKNATFVGTPTFGTIGGVSSFNLNGTSQGFTSSLLSNDLNSFTVEAWVKRTNNNSVSGTTVGQKIFGQYGATTNNPRINFGIKGTTFQVGDSLSGPPAYFSRPATISNPTGSTIANALTLVTLDTTSLISASKLASDCSNLRVKATDQTTDLSYYIETGVQGCNKSNTAIWVRIPSLVNGNTTIYLQYGQSGLSSLSSLSNTIPSLATNNQLWFDASRGTSSTTNNVAISSWNDQSGSGRNASATVANPLFKTNALNGRPVVGFSSAATNPNTRLRFSTVSNIRSTFWVIKHNTGTDNNWATILGRGPEDVQPDFHGGSGTALFNGTFTSSLVTGGSGYVNGSLTTVTNITKPTSFSTISLVTTDNVSANALGADDRNQNWDRTWNGDIAEVLAFSSALSATDRQEVENYLNLKYQMYNTSNLVTSSLGSETPQGGGSATDFNYDSTFIPNTDWQQVVLTYNNSNQQGSIFVNGVEQRRFTQALDTPGSSPITLGFANSTNYFNGNISLVRVYNSPLSALQVKQNFDADKSRFGFSGNSPTVTLPVSASFGSFPVSSTATDSPVTIPNITIKDRRSNFTTYTASISLGNFVAGSFSIPSSQVRLTSTGSLNLQQGASTLNIGSPVNPRRTGNSGGVFSGPQSLLINDYADGGGTFVYSPQLTVTIPPYTIAASYTAPLTITVLP